MQKVEEMKEYLDAQLLIIRIKKLSKKTQAKINQKIANYVCWHGPVTQKWLESEIESYELVEEMFGKPIEDHPIEDMFGSEIQTGDKWFQDSAGRVVLEENAKEYLLEIAGVEFFRGIE